MSRGGPRASRRHGTQRVKPLGFFTSPGKRGLTKTAAMAALGPVLYAVRLDGDVIKIGCTATIARRLRELPHDEVLAVFPGTLTDETELHRREAEHHLNPTGFPHQAPVAK